MVLRPPAASDHKGTSVPFFISVLTIPFTVMESTMKNFSDNSSQSHHFAEVSLRYSPSADMALRPKLHAPNDVFEYLLKLWDLDTIEISETFYVLLFNNKNRLLGWSQISKGSRSATVVDVGHIVTLALLGNASHLVIAHNLPS